MSETYHRLNENEAPTTENITCPSDREECINLAEQARDLIDFLQTDGCLDCDEYSSLLDTIDTMQTYIKNSQPLNAWVACGERLPDEDIEVIVFNGKTVFVDYVIDDFEGAWDSLDDITHWRELPQPPETGKDGE